MQQKEQKLPEVACKKLKNILKKCGLAFQSQRDPESNSSADGVVQIKITSCHNHCPGMCISQTLINNPIMQYNLLNRLYVV